MFASRRCADRGSWGRARYESEMNGTPEMGLGKARLAPRFRRPSEVALAVATEGP